MEKVNVSQAPEGTTVGGSGSLAFEFLLWRTAIKQPVGRSTLRCVNNEL